MAIVTFTTDMMDELQDSLDLLINDKSYEQDEMEDDNNIEDIKSILISKLEEDGYEVQDFDRNELKILNSWQDEFNRRVHINIKTEDENINDNMVNRKYYTILS